MIVGLLERIRIVEERELRFTPGDINIGLVGDVYTLWEPYVNHDIVRRLSGMGVGVHVSLTLSWYIKNLLGIADTKKHLHREAEVYFKKPIGGHGWESVYNTIHYASNGFDGVIHLLPLTCMPETIAEMPVDMIGSDYGIPVYRFSFDENRFDAGVETRLETFVKILRRNKTKKNEVLARN
jgi:predicted nucleotide-binding protein (sugar kinase/HSP70/actin superfamily)